MVDSVSLVVVLLLLSYACADAPTSNNTVFVNPSNTTTGPIVWELGTTQVIQWNTTASPLSLDLYQYISETKNYESAYIFYDFENITEYAWTVDTVEPLDSTGQGLFHLKLVPPNYNGLPGEGLDGITFTIKDPNFKNSSSSSFSISSSTVSSTTSTTTTSLTTSLLSTTTAIFQAATPLPTNNPTTAPSSGLSSSAKTGLGVGLGLGLTALILLNAFAVIWYVRRHKRKPSVPPKDTSPQGIQHHAQGGPLYPLAAQVSLWTQKQTFAEVGDTSRGEMADTSRGELDGNERRAELNAWRT